MTEFTSPYSLSTQRGWHTSELHLAHVADMTDSVLICSCAKYYGILELLEYSQCFKCITQVTNM